jgi:MFS family permease
MAVFTLILALNENIFVLIVVSFLLGIVTKGTAPVTQIMVGNTVVHKNHYKHAFSLDAFVSNVGTLMASVGFGLIGDMLGIQSVFIGFTITAVIAAILGGLYHQQMKNLDNPIVR